MIGPAVAALACAAIVAQGGAPQARTVAKGDQSRIDQARQAVVRTDAEWAALWRQHAGDGGRPAVDFSREMILAVFMGSRPSAGFSTAIVSTLDANGVLTVRYRETRPARDAVTAQVITAPYDIVAVPSSASEVRFVRDQP